MWLVYVPRPELLLELSVPLLPGCIQEIETKRMGAIIVVNLYRDTNAKPITHTCTYTDYVVLLIKEWPDVNSL